jgi:imidazolonepropionase-like amidohydrolase
VLATYAKHGVTTVFSLGNDQNAAEALAVRDRQNDAKLARARLFTSGVIVTGPTPDAARAQVRQNAQARVDNIKIRVDDNFGTTAKMPVEVYRAVIDEAHKNNLRVAAHLYYLQDAKSLLEAGADVVAHSIRDREVDAALIAQLKTRNVCVVPTLTRDLSTFVYEDVPAFFTDPLFQKYADASAVTTLRTPARLQARKADPNNAKNKAGLEMAKRNLKTLSAGGVTIAMGTDSGAGAERFPGYFELLEMEMMVQSGLTPAQVLASATRDAARCLGQGDALGTLAPGRFADLVVLDANPLDDIANIKKISAVYVGGQAVAR